MKRILLSLGCCLYLSANQIVHDVNTGLMWQDITPKENNQMNWDNAMQHCSNLTFNGFSDWRLPTLFELKNVVGKKMTVVEIKDGTRMSRRKMKEGFQNIDLARFWTSTESSGYKDKAWIVYAGYGGVDHIDLKIYNSDVMCVRDTKAPLKFDSFSSLQFALKSKYSGKELTQKALEIYYGKPSIKELKYDAYSSTFSAIGSFGGDNLSKNITLTMSPSEAKAFFDNYKNITPSGVFDVKEDNATLKTIRFNNNGKKYNSVFVDKPIEADSIKEFKDSDDGKMFQVITSDNTLYLIDKKTSKVVAVLDASQASHMSFQTTSKDNNFAMLLDPKTNSYSIFDSKTKQELLRLPSTYSNYTTFSVSADKHYLSLVGKNNTFKILDIDSKQELITLSSIDYPAVKLFAFSPDKQYLTLTNNDGSKVVLDVKSQKELYTFEANSPYKDFEFLTLGDNQQFVALKNTDNSLVILDTVTKKEIVTLVGNYNNVKSFELSSDNKYLTLTTNENQYKILDVTSKKELITLTTPNQLGNFTTLNVSDNKQFIALTRADNTLVVLDAVTKKELFSLASPVANTTSLVFDDLKKTVTLSNASGEKQTLKLSEYIEKQNQLVKSSTHILESHKQKINTADIIKDDNEFEVSQNSVMPKVTSPVIRDDIKEIVYDPTTRLMWQDNSEVKNDAKIYYVKGLLSDSYPAKEYCDDLKLGGYSDWRLPNLPELRTLIDFATFNPAIRKGFKNVGLNSLYWSNSISSFADRSVWAMDFNGAMDNTYQYARNYYFFVRCVRDSTNKI